MAFLYDPRDAGESRPSSSSIAKTYILASPSSLPTHPYKKRLGHYKKKGLLAPSLDLWSLATIGTQEAPGVLTWHSY
jgi:hypothetical protein